jgi:hypothetical protein
MIFHNFLKEEAGVIADEDEHMAILLGLEDVERAFDVLQSPLSFGLRRRCGR